LEPCPSPPDRDPLNVTAITKCLIPVPSVSRFTVAARAVSQCDHTSDWMVRAGLMEKIMSKSNDTSKLASRDRELRDDELDAVSGGLVVISIIQPLFGLLLPAVNSGAKPPSKP
jgi:hypothetical protein